MFNFRRTILILNALFIGLVGFAQMIFELLSHFLGIGPLGNMFVQSAYTVGFFEAHGFAVLTSVLALVLMVRDMKPYWHLYMAAVCFLLGGSNLLFWDGFAKVGLVTAGYVATTLHILFLVLQTFCYVKAGSAQQSSYAPGNAS